MILYQRVLIVILYSIIRTYIFTKVDRAEVRTPRGVQLDVFSVSRQISFLNSFLPLPAIFIYYGVLTRTAKTLDTTPITFAKMRLQPCFNMQYGPYGHCPFSHRKV